MEIIEDTATPFRCLLIHDASGTTWRLVLEQENDEHVIETLLTCSGRAPFVPVPLQRFAPGLHLSVQRYKRAPMVGVHNYDNQKLEIYDIDLDKYPLYVYQLFPDVTSAILTDKVIFAASTRTVGPARISVVSNIIAGTSGNPVYALDRKIKESIMQMFTLAPNETLLAIVPAFPISRMMANKFRYACLLLWLIADSECAQPRGSRCDARRVHCHHELRRVRTSRAHPCRADLYRAAVARPRCRRRARQDNAARHFPPVRVGSRPAVL